MMKTMIEAPEKVNQSELEARVEDMYKNVALYPGVNDSNGRCEEVSNDHFEGTMDGTVDLADIDGDGDLDVLISGNTYDSLGESLYNTYLYVNNGNGSFERVGPQPFDDVTAGDIEFADIDNDLDVLITGQTKIGAVWNLYRNDGAGNFSFHTTLGIGGIYNSSVGFSDVDGDNDKDLVVIGYYMVPQTGLVSTTGLFKNDGTGNFTVISICSLRAEEVMTVSRNFIQMMVWETSPWPMPVTSGAHPYQLLPLEIWIMTMIRT